MNLVLIKSDQHLYNALGCMGHKVVKTPNIDRLAKEGCLCTDAFTTSPICGPSRIGFFTGKYVHRTGACCNSAEHHIRPGIWSILEPLKERGYAIGVAGKNHAFSDEYFEKYLDFREEYSATGFKLRGTITEGDRKVKEYRTRRPEGKGDGRLLAGSLLEPEPFPEEQCPAYRMAEDAVTFLDKHHGGPFFLNLNFSDPHEPQLVCDPYFSMYDPDEVELEGSEMDWSGHPYAHWVQSQALGFDKYSETERRRILANYYGQISFVDKGVGMVVDKLRELKLMDETIIVFTADHGDFGGRYGMLGKTKAFYDCLVRIPLIVRMPGLVGGRRTDAQISNIDVMPTLAEALGVAIPEDVQGESFLPVLKGERSEHRSEVFAEVGRAEYPPDPLTPKEYEARAIKRLKEDGPMWFCEYTGRGRSAMVRADGWKYCYYVNDKEELYNMEKDPLELTNLAGRPEFREKEAEMRRRLFDWLLMAPYRHKTE